MEFIQLRQNDGRTGGDDMNWLCVIILAVLVLYILNGARRGMVRTAFSLAGIVLTLVLGYLFSPYITEFITEKTPVYDSIQKSCEKSITGLIEDKIEESTDRQEQETFIMSLPVPRELQEILIKNNNEEGYHKLVAETFGEYLSNSAAQLAVNVISLILTVLAVGIVIRILEGFLDGIFSLPVLSLLNRAGGALLGAVQGLLFVWIVFLVLMLFFDTGWSRTAVRLIQENEITGFLYNNNMLMRFITGFFRV